MVSRKYTGLVCVVFAVGTFLTVEATAKSFKAKYYKECAAEVKEAVKLITPKESMSAKAGKLGGLFGKVGSFAGLGGAGGSVYKAAGTINKIKKYSGLIDNAAAFSAQMTADHPDPNDRFAAYGTYMTNDGKNISQVQSAVASSQACYEKKYTELVSRVVSKDLKKRKAKKRLKEIQKGTRASGDALLFAMQHLNKNLNSFNQSLSNETQYISLSQVEVDRYRAAGINPATVQNAFDQANGRGGTLPSAGSVVGNFGNLGLLSGLAGKLGKHSVTGEPNAGLRTIATSSQEYLALHQLLTDSAEKQRVLELKVNAGF